MRKNYQNLIIKKKSIFLTRRSYVAQMQQFTGVLDTNIIRVKKSK